MFHSDLLHFGAAGALAGVLADGFAFAVRGTATLILADSLKGPFLLPTGGLEHGFTFFDLGDLGLDHITAAGAFPLVVGDGVAGAFLAAVADEAFVPDLKSQGALFCGHNKRSQENKNKRKNNQGFFHKVFPPRLCYYF